MQLMQAEGQKPWTILLWVCATQALMYLLGIWSVEILNDENLQQAWRVWNRWDSPHYLDLAKHGYSNHGELGLFIVFYPAYPALIKCLSWLTHDPYLSGLIISFTSLFIAALALNKIGTHYLGQDKALSSVWYLLVFPCSFFFHIAYTEALFLACLLCLWLAMLERRWLLVGALGAALCATRINGALVGLPIAWEVLRLIHQERRFDPRYFYLLLIPCGLTLYLAINYWQYDNPWYFLEVQKNHWHKSPGTPVMALQDLWHRLGWDKRNFWLMGVFEITAVGLAIASTVYAYKRLSISAALWCLGNLILITSTGWALSLPRYLLIFFPLYFMLAELAHKPQFKALLDLICLSSFTLLAMEFARGRWAF